MCLSSQFFLFPNFQLIPKRNKNLVFSQVHAACVSRPNFSSSLIHNLFQNVQSIVFSQVHACLFRPIFSYSLIHD